VEKSEDAHLVLPHTAIEADRTALVHGLAGISPERVEKDDEERD
jgi:hypothetical protein